MKALTKADMAAYLFDFGLSRRDSKILVDTFFEEIRDALTEGEEVRLSGFGNFKLRDKKSRPGRNPRTRTPAEISARRVVTFKAGQKLQTQLSDVPVPKEEL